MGGSPALAARDSGLAGNERDDGAHDYDFYRAIQGYLDAAARLARIEQSVQAILCQPTNEFP